MDGEGGVENSLGNGGVVVLNLLNGGPTFYVSRVGCHGVCCVRILIVIVIVVAVTAAIVTVVGPVTLAPVVVVVIDGGVIVLPRQALAFFTASLGPAVRFGMPNLVAVVTFNVVHIALLLAVCGKSFIGAIPALKAGAVVVLVSDKSNNSIRCYWHAHLITDR